MTRAEMKLEAYREVLECDFIVDEKILEAAMKKAERWMRNAYGAIDWTELHAESDSQTVCAFYRETQKLPTGMGTFNREGMQSRKKDQR